MSSMKEYSFYKCRDCELDFLLAVRGSGRTRTFCPKCGENLYTEKVASVWMNRPFYSKTPWTEEEDSILAPAKRRGHSGKEIAAMLEGRTPRACHARWHQMIKKELV